MKKWLETIREIQKNPKGKAILFFGFYLVFFVVIILFVRFSSRRNPYLYEYEKGNSTVNQIYELQGFNYEYRYHITIDDNTYEFEGKRHKKNEVYTYLDDSYYCNQEECFVLKEKWMLSEQKIPFHSLLEPDHIAKIIEEAHLESKTSYESGQTVYTYQVLVDSLNHILYEEDTDLDLEANTISIRIDENGELSLISFELNSYCQYRKSCEKNLKIDAEYSQIGEIDVIENPVMSDS